MFLKKVLGAEGLKIAKKDKTERLMNILSSLIADKRIDLNAKRYTQFCSGI